MTTSQEKTIRAIISAAEEQIFYSEGNYEFKRFEVEDFGSFVSVQLEVGRIGDEGTLAELYARDRAHMFVGKKGGIRYPVYGGKTKRLRGYNILTVVCAQER